MPTFYTVYIRNTFIRGDERTKAGGAFVTGGSKREYEFYGGETGIFFYIQKSLALMAGLFYVRFRHV